MSLSLIDQDRYTAYYRHYFFNKEHVNFLGYDKVCKRGEAGSRSGKGGKKEEHNKAEEKDKKYTPSNHILTPSPPS